MEKHNISDILKGNSYPGRGIVIGQSEDKQYAVIAYFIMGRSVNSRNRVFVTDGDDMRTKAFDESKLSDPSLIIYYPVRMADKAITVVTNGDQTDTIVDFMKSGKSFEDALATREFEPDAPNFTPRISGAVYSAGGDFTYKLSILKSGNGNPEACNRFYYNYAPVAGEGHFIHTYKQDGDPIPSFEGEPALISVPSDIDSFTSDIWNSLNADNKVSLFTRFINLATDESETRIINKHK